MRPIHPARVAAIAFAAALVVGCADVAPYTPPPSSGMPSLIAGVRRNFRKHWAELQQDPSPAAARTRAEVVAWAIDDVELHAMLARHESFDRVVARAIEDATKATEAFPESADVWVMLARLKLFAGDLAGAEMAGCRARDVDVTVLGAWATCPYARGARVSSWPPRSSPATAKSAPTAREHNDPHIALRAAEERVPAICRWPARRLSWAELVACGDNDATRGSKSYARYLYRTAALGATDDERQFLALQRIDEMDGDCESVLDALPIGQRAKYERWKTSLSGKLRPPLPRAR